MPHPSGRRSLYAELRRRNVLRAAVLYVGAVWALAQGVSQLAPAVGLPDFATRWFLVACAIGFPFWVAFAWYYELTPEGFKRESEVEHSESVTRQTARRLDYWIIGALSVAVILLLTNTLVWHRGAGLEHADTAFDPPANSIVVLPFVNLSDDPRQQYFSDGITEELTNALGRNRALTVIAWNTASRFGNGKQTPRQIGKALNVAQMLGGSIQRAGDKVRVSAELVSTVTGQQLWAAHYDDSLKNIFAVQDRISEAISDALKVKFVGTRDAPTTNPKAHELYLRGLAAIDQQTATDAQRAQQFFQQALALDPDYAEAWAGLANAYMQLTEYSTLPIKDAAVKIRSAADNALALEPQDSDAWVVLGIAHFFDGDTAQAQTAFRQALALDPNNVRAHLDYGVTLPPRGALAQMLEATRLDPDNVTAQSNLAGLYWQFGDLARAAATSEAIIGLSPHNVDNAFNLAGIYVAMGRKGDAAKAFDLVQPQTGLDRRLLEAGKLTYQASLNPKLRPKALAALGRLRGAALSPNQEGDIIGLYMALGDKETALTMLPHMCAAEPSLCSNLAADTSSPLRGDPRFEKLAQKYSTVTHDAAPASTSSG